MLIATNEKRDTPVFRDVTKLIALEAFDGLRLGLLWALLCHFHAPAMTIDLDVIQLANRVLCVTLIIELDECIIFDASV